MNLGFNTRYKYFAPRIGVAYRVNGQDGHPRWLWRQLHAVPG